MDRINTVKMIEFLRKERDDAYTRIKEYKKANDLHSALDEYICFSVYDFLVEVLVDEKNELHYEVMDKPEEGGRTLAKLKEALEKQEAMKPVVKQLTVGDIEVECPACGDVHIHCGTKYGFDYCPRCGQKHEWRKESGSISGVSDSTDGCNDRDVDTGSGVHIVRSFDKDCRSNEKE